MSWNDAECLGGEDALKRKGEGALGREECTVDDPSRPFLSTTAVR